MAHYALLDNNNIVTQVIVGVSEDKFIEGKTPEDWYKDFTGQKCVRTSYNTVANTHRLNGTPFRGNYAGIGFKYDEDFDIFIPPKPYPSWKLNYTTCQWEAPIPSPEKEEGFIWKWSEINKEWVKVAIPSVA